MKFKDKIGISPIALTIILIALSIGGCRKLIEINPPTTKVTANSVYNSDATAIAVLTGLYTKISGTNHLGGGAGEATSLSIFGSLSADELNLWSGSTNIQHISYFKNALSSDNSTGAGFEFWTSFYAYIFTCNSAIEGLSNTNSLTPSVKQQLMGEAKFMRAFFYFYLVNLYGDVPLVLTSDYKVNSSLARSPKSEVWQQIISDLKDAQNLLSTNYFNGVLLNNTTERVRPNIWVANALLARVYLHIGAYSNAEEQATTIINNSTTYDTVSINNVFLKNNKEAIWQLQPVNSGFNTEDAKFFIIPGTGLSGTNPVYLSNNLLTSFEAGDMRKINWIDSVTINGTTYYYPFKYKVSVINSPVTEYHTVLRLAEQYLIRSEARAQQGNISGAAADLNVIRRRAGLAPTNASTQATLLTAIQHERQVELFTEWGHRWIDLKRTNTVDAVMSVVTPQKGGTWSTYWQWYPLPILDIQHDPNLIPNQGY